MKKILLLDTAFSAAPIYTALLNDENEVWVMGNRAGDILARRAGARWIDQNYSSVETVVQCAATHQFDHIVPGCTDVSIATRVQVPLDTNLVDSHAVNCILGDKGRFRQLCEELDLPAPHRIQEEQFPIKGSFICKPVDAFSGRGVTVFDGLDSDSLRAAQDAAIRASPSGQYLIETFADGDLYSCSAFVEEGRLIDVFYVREGSSSNPYAVDTSYVVHDMSADIKVQLEASLASLCLKLHLKDGLLHSQFIVSNGAPIIIEIMRRCPGDLYSLLIEYSTGYQYAAKYASYFLGKTFSTHQTCKKHILRHTLTSLDNAIYQGIFFKKSLAVRAIFPLMIVGQDLLGRQGNRAGIIFTESSSHGEAVDDFNQLLNRDIYELW